MVFKVTNIYTKKDSDNVLVTGRFSSETDEDKEDLAVLVDVFKELDTVNEHFKSNEHTILFTSLQAKLLRDLLKYLSKELELSIEVWKAKNFTGNKDLYDSVFVYNCEL